jgi:hypothetical protein
MITTLTTQTHFMRKEPQDRSMMTSRSFVRCSLVLCSRLTTEFPVAEAVAIRVAVAKAVMIDLTMFERCGGLRVWRRFQ